MSTGHGEVSINVPTSYTTIDDKLIPSINLIVEITSDGSTLTSSHSALEIWRAWKQGKFICVQYHNRGYGIAYPIYIGHDYCIFKYFTPSQVGKKTSYGNAYVSETIIYIQDSYGETTVNIRDTTLYVAEIDEVLMNEDTSIESEKTKAQTLYTAIMTDTLLDDENESTIKKIKEFYLKGIYKKSQIDAMCKSVKITNEEYEYIIG